MQQLANGELRTQVVKWNVECCKIHLAMKEIIHAKAQKLIANELYEKMLSTMCSKLCALPVCTMAWIINYRKTMPASKIGMYETLSNIKVSMVYLVNYTIIIGYPNLKLDLEVQFWLGSVLHCCGIVF